VGARRARMTRRSRRQVIDPGIPAHPGIEHVHALGPVSVRVGKFDDDSAHAGFESAKSSRRVTGPRVPMSAGVRPNTNGTLIGWTCSSESSNSICCIGL